VAIFQAAESRLGQVLGVCSRGNPTDELARRHRSHGFEGRGQTRL
jgi:hypothetical protein